MREERGLVGTLKEIIKKMHKKIAETVQEREEIREQVGIQGKTMAHLRDKIYKTRDDMEAFYDRAN